MIGDIMMGIGLLELSIMMFLPVLTIGIVVYFIRLLTRLVHAVEKIAENSEK